MITGARKSHRGRPNRCPVCSRAVVLDSTFGSTGEASCPNCDTLLWVSYNLNGKTHFKQAPPYSNLPADDLTRFEETYFVNREHVERVRRFLRRELSPAVGSGACDFPVCDLYLDSPRFAFYNQSLRIQKNRFKLRMRCYDQQLAAVVVEIKRWETDATKKRYAVVSRAGALQILKQQPASKLMLFKKDGNMDALDDFCRLA